MVPHCQLYGSAVQHEVGQHQVIPQQPPVLVLPGPQESRPSRTQRPGRGAASPGSQELSGGQPVVAAQGPRGEQDEGDADGA